MITEKNKPLDDGQEGKGLRWVKASERLPENLVAYRPIRIVHSGLQFYGLGNLQSFHNGPAYYDIVSDNHYSFDNVEWLDETPALPVADGEGSIESLMKKAMHSPELLTKEERNKIINHKMTNEQIGEKIEEMALPSAVTGGVKEPLTDDTFVIGIKSGKITFLKSYNYFSQKDEAQKDLQFVQDEKKFTGWYISHVGSWLMEHKTDKEDRFEIAIPMPIFQSEGQP